MVRSACLELSQDRTHSPLKELSGIVVRFSPLVLTPSSWLDHVGMIKNGDRERGRRLYSEMATVCLGLPVT
jgi:hypothetical protein